MRTSAHSRYWLVRVLVLGMLMLGLNPVLGFIGGAAAQEGEQETPGPVVNVELVFDSSGSMAQEVAPGVTRIEAAKSVLNDVIDAMPEREGVNVGFRVYGHEGSNQEADREESCQSTDLVVPIEGVNKEALREAVARYEPVGWTPITLALQEAAEDFSAPQENERNAVVLVTDGLETCGGDPCAAAEALAQGDVSVTTYVIGFALAEGEQETLQCIADAGGGLNLGAGSAEELNRALFTVLEELQVVVQTGFLEIEAFGDVFPRATIVCRAGATDSNPEGEEQTVVLTDSNRVELNVGLCEVSWVNPSGSETEILVNILPDETTWVRGSLLKFPQGAGEIYIVTDLGGTVIWQDQFEQGDFVWVLPGIYRMELLERVGDPILISAEVQTLPGTVTQLEIFTAGS
ncbi:MAG TPA: VWA domain-containing protein [Thermomicrobiales bacterium]|nr:VWA domain-containing protein [Thermomicrobiales bacterium]